MRVPRLAKNEDGVILLTVIMLTILLSLVILGFMSASVSQVKSSQTVIDQMKAEQLALGSFYRYNQWLIDGNADTPPAYEYQLDGKSFQVSYYNETASGMGPYDTGNLLVEVSYY